MTIKTDLGYIDITNEVLAGRARNFWQATQLRSASA